MGRSADNHGGGLRPAELRPGEAHQYERYYEVICRVFVSVEFTNSDQFGVLLSKAAVERKAKFGTGRAAEGHLALCG